MVNKEIRDTAKQNGVKLWEVADYLGIADSTFCRQLRKELHPDRKKAVLQAVSLIAERKADDGRN